MRDSTRNDPVVNSPTGGAQLGERVAIIGSRGWPYKEDVYSYVRGLPRDTVIVSGGAVGPDTWAERTARNRGMKVRVFRPDWNLGRGAGHIRNAQIVASADRVVAFWDGKSRGTRGTIEIANRAGKPVEVYCPHEVEM